jgi:sodium/hydrogen exchanger 8
MYSPYVFAEAIKLSGIMAILFAGLVMSHYTHLNLSSVTRITVQQIFRTLSFIAETCVFAYLGLAIFSFKHIFKPSLVISSILMCLLGRACNIFPLSYLLNYFREHKITRKMQFIMWFSGLRGAIAFALSLNLDIDNETRHVIVTSTLILVLFTTLVLGGSTMPLMKYLNADKNNRRKQTKFVFLSKTKEMGETVDPFTEDENQSANLNNSNSENDAVSSVNIHIVRSDMRLRGFARLDEAFLKPFFTRKFTDEELRRGQSDINKLTKQWFDDANRDGKFPNADSTVYFKKSSNRANGLNSKKQSNDKTTYHMLNATSSSSNNILLESTDEDENEEVVIDKTNSFIN